MAIFLLLAPPALPRLFLFFSSAPLPFPTTTSSSSSSSSSVSVTLALPPPFPFPFFPAKRSCFFISDSLFFLPGAGVGVSGPAVSESDEAAVGMSVEEAEWSVGTSIGGSLDWTSGGRKAVVRRIRARVRRIGHSRTILGRTARSERGVGEPLS